MCVCAHVHMCYVCVCVDTHVPTCAKYICWYVSKKAASEHIINYYM